MFSYYGIAAATVGSILNYLLLGLAPNLDQFYLHSFEILLACVVVFPALGNLGFTLLEYRIGHRSLAGALIENLRWIPFLYVNSSFISSVHTNEPLISVFFFGGLSIHLSTAILAHLCSYDMTWGSTGKEVEKSTFWIEGKRSISLRILSGTNIDVFLVPRIFQRFWLTLLICTSLIIMVVIFTTDLIPFEYQIAGWNWSLIIPLALVIGSHMMLPVGCWVVISVICITD
jgi:hypothetical protein